MNTLERWQRLAARVSFAALPWRLILRVEREGHRLRIVLVAQVLDRDTLRPFGLEHSQTISEEIASRMSDAHALDAIRAVVWNFATHEVDEAMLVDGARMFDPHAREVAGIEREAKAA